MSENTKNPAVEKFLPVCKADMLARGWRDVDFVLVTGDAYVDHPSFGAAIISRLLEAEGYRVGVISQPDFTTCESMKEFGRPRYGFFIGGGNVDSMVAHYSVAKIRRAQDEYTPGGAAGKRPDRSATVYTQLAKQAYPDLPVILGGLEASLRRFAHYDYWLDDVLPSIVESSGADIVSFGMGERQTAEIARRLAAGEPVEEITGVAGTCYLTDFAGLPASYVPSAPLLPKGARGQDEHMPEPAASRWTTRTLSRASPWCKSNRERYLVQNPPADAAYTARAGRRACACPSRGAIIPPTKRRAACLPFGEVEFSIIHNRGCFGGCNFCAIASCHQGRRVTSRSAGQHCAQRPRP